jgi:hypothetical protein
MLVVRPDGKTPDKPHVLGKPNGDEPIQVYATGLYMGIMKGETRWVTGDKVDEGLDGGVIVLLGTLLDEEDPVEQTGYSGPGLVSPEQVRAEVVTSTSTDVDAKLADMSKSELVKIARAVSLDGRAGMDKNELYEHLRHHPDVAALID